MSTGTGARMRFALEATPHWRALSATISWRTPMSIGELRCP